MGVCFMGNFLLIIYIAVSLIKWYSIFLPQKDPVPMEQLPQKEPVLMSLNELGQKRPGPFCPMNLLIIFTIIVIAITIAVIIFIFFTFSHNKHLRFN